MPQQSHGAGAVSYRFASVAATESATATYTPNIPVAGFYPVYTWVLSSANRTNQLYRINHTGGQSLVRVPHHMVGNGWVYLGSYYFNAGSSPADPVLVIQAMGRKIGFIPAAARLADPHRELPLLIVLTESGLTMPELADKVNDLLKTRGRAVVVVSEGFEVGDIGAREDSFGHTEFGSSEIQVGQAVINALNRAGLPVHGSARTNIPGTDQRHSMIYASTVDLDEAYQVGCKAVEIAASGENGYMATILRESGAAYRVRLEKVPLEQVANSERHFPAPWIADTRADVTEDFVRYAQPLIGNEWPVIPLENGNQRYARFKPIFAAQKLPT